MAGHSSLTWTRVKLMTATVLVVVFLLIRTSGAAKVFAAGIPDHVQLQPKHHHLISKLSHYELVRPYRSTAEGGFLSHDLTTGHEEKRNVYERAKRHTARQAGGHDEDELRLNHHFRVDGFGARLRLNVSRNRFLVTPSMKVERYDENGHRQVYRPDTLCFYTGQVSGSPGSTVAVSNCNGLSGFIKTDEEEYVIEPLESQADRSKVNVSLGHLHIMYQSKDFNAESNDLLTALLPKDLRHDSPDEAGLPGAGGRHSGRPGRAKRRAGDPGQKHFVETLLAADYSMTSFHGIDEMTTYLLTVLNIVNMAYRHETMTSDIQFAATRIIILNEAMSRDLVIERQAQASLSNVCRWAAGQTVRDDTQANHHDLAAFITRLDFGPAGYAPVTGMCAMTRSCALSRDEGLLSSFVLAHEAGHVFGMEHDGDGNSCTEDRSRGSIMAPVVISTYSNHFWSTCSIRKLNRYLPNYDCLEDDPFESGLPELDGYPGEWYTRDEQCSFHFGNGFEHCGGVCSRLSCRDTRNPLNCRSTKGPPLDGSYCGPKMWCLQGICSYEDHERQDGGWSKFSPWSECSYPCDVGAQVRKRQCDNPPPAYAGKDCKGEPYKYRLCNKKPCVGVYEDRRAKQCLDSLTSYAHGGSTHEWLPYENRNKTLQCRLTCITKRTNEVVVAEYNVTDGTPCSYDNHHSICIQGKCVKLGCDKQINSSKVEDKCGVCDGDNSECAPINGNFYQAPKKKYQVIHTLPAGSRNIDIRENSNTDNFLALRRMPIKEYILNAQGTQSGPHSFIGGGARFVYSPDEDRLVCVGPLFESLELLVFWKKNSQPMNVSYSYYLGSQRPSPSPSTEPEPDQPDFVWQDEGWTDCTKTCGGGFTFHRFQCYRTSDNAPVKKTFCGQGQYNPKEGKKACNTQPCERLP